MNQQEQIKNSFVILDYIIFYLIVQIANKQFLQVKSSQSSVISVDAGLIYNRSNSSN